jgi:hypothetical protein
MDNEQIDLAAARRRRDELMARMMDMDPAAIDEMQKFLRSLPADMFVQLRADIQDQQAGESR